MTDAPFRGEQPRSVQPAARLRGEPRLPGDKSISHRALIMAALAEGRSLISGAGDGRDVQSTAGIMAALGMPTPLLLGAVAAVLNFVPYFGPIVNAALLAGSGRP